MISAYCLDYHMWTCVPHQIEENFRELKEMGVDTVCLSFCESDMTYARRTFEIIIEIAHRIGLRVFVIPSRIAGRFAGAPLMASTWLVKHPQYQIPDKYWMPIGCLECREVREFIKEVVGTLISDYDIDGIVWDEPKGTDLISHHPDTVKKFGENPTLENMADSFYDFFADLTEFCHKMKPSLIQTLFCQKTDPEYFTKKMATTPCIDYFGYDGNLCRQRIFKEQIFEGKYRIESVWDRTVEECAQAEKKRFALIESMHMPREEHENFEKAFDNYLSHYHPEHLSIYYYAHNADDPEELNEIIKRVMKKHFAG